MFDLIFAHVLLQTSYNGVSKSTLRLTAKIADDGRYLTCRGESQALHNTAMEDQWHLQVHCEYRVHFSWLSNQENGHRPFFGRRVQNAKVAPRLFTRVEAHRGASDRAINVKGVGLGGAFPRCMINASIKYRLPSRWIALSLAKANAEARFNGIWKAIWVSPLALVSFGLLLCYYCIIGRTVW